MLLLLLLLNKTKLEILLFLNIAIIKLFHCKLKNHVLKKNKTTVNQINAVILFNRLQKYNTNIYAILNLFFKW